MTKRTTKKTGATFAGAAKAVRKVAQGLRSKASATQVDINDAIDLDGVATSLEAGDLRDALYAARMMDTAARDRIPFSVYDLAVDAGYYSHTTDDRGRDHYAQIKSFGN